MAATASIIIEVQDGQATTAFQRINSEAGKLGTTLQPVARISEQTFNNIEGGALKARESAALLGEEVGIHIPRALRGVLAQSSLVGPALTAAFSGLAIAGFIQILATAVMDFAAQIMSISDTTRQAVFKIQQDAMSAEMSMLESAQSKNRELQVRTAVATANDLQKLDAHYHAERQALIEERLKAEEQARLTGEHDVVNLANKNLLQLDAAHLAEKKELLLKESDNVQEAMDAQVAASKKGRDRILADAKIAIDRINAAEKEGGMLHELAEVRRAQLHAETDEKLVNFDEETIEKQRMLAAAGQQAILQAEASASTGRQQIEKELVLKLNEITARETQEHLALLKKGIEQDVNLDDERLAAKIEYNHKLLELTRQRADEEIQIETEAAIAMLPSWRRADVQIMLSAQERIRKIEEMQARDKDFFLQGEREKAAIMEKEWADRVQSMASQLEGLYDEVTTGGIGQFFLKRFKHLLFEMVASWIIGMTQMRAASQQQMGGSGQGGGFLGAIFGSLGLGGIFGGGGSSGGGGAPDASASVLQNLGMMSGMPSFSGGGMSGSGETSSESGGFGSSLFGALGLSAGGGAGSGTILPSGAGPGGSGGLLDKLFSNDQGGISGSLFGLGGLALLSATFRRGGVLGGLGGALGGAMLGTAILPGIGTLIGAIIGGIIGIFGKSTKKARLAIEANIKAQSQKIEDSYNLFQTDWSSSRDALEQLRQQGVDALKQAGVKDISRSRVGHVDQWVNKAEKEIDATQAERNRRGALVFGPPEFHRGGLVTPELAFLSPGMPGARAFHSGGVVNANLLPGEFVMRPEAVSRIGPGNLSRMNSGGGSGGGDTHVTINAIDASSFKEFLSRKGGVEIIKFFAQARNEGML